MNLHKLTPALVAAVLALSLALIGAGCGSSGGDSSQVSNDNNAEATSGDGAQPPGGDGTQASTDESGSATNGDNARLTKAEFIEQADAVCRKDDKAKQEDVEAFGKETGVTEGKPLTAAIQKRFILDVAMPPIRTEAKELRSLGPPDEPEASEILDGLEKAIDASEAKAREGKAADTFADVAIKARKYGFKACILYY
jgi:hypothetical protein